MLVFPHSFCSHLFDGVGMPALCTPPLNYPDSPVDARVGYSSPQPEYQSAVGIYWKYSRPWRLSTSRWAGWGSASHVNKNPWRVGRRRSNFSKQKQLFQLPVTGPRSLASYFWILSLTSLSPSVSMFFCVFVPRNHSFTGRHQHKSLLTATRQPSAGRGPPCRAPTVCPRRCSRWSGDTRLHKATPQKWPPLRSGATPWLSPHTRGGSGWAPRCPTVSSQSSLSPSRTRAATPACTAHTWKSTRAPPSASPLMVCYPTPYLITSQNSL